MGSCESKTNDKLDANLKNNAINRSIELDKKEKESTIKLLLLGIFKFI